MYVQQMLLRHNELAPKCLPPFVEKNELEGIPALGPKFF